MKTSAHQTWDKVMTQQASQMEPVVKNLLENVADVRCSFGPWVGKIPWRMAQQPTPVFLPGESHGQRMLTGYSSQGRKMLDTIEEIYQHACNN